MFLFLHEKCEADTLFINAKYPDWERILIYDGKYYIQLKIGEQEGAGTKLTLVGGTYEIKDNQIFFIDPAPWDDTIKNKYYTWNPRRLGPDFTVDYEMLVQDIFDLKIELGMVGSTHWLVAKGKFLEGNIMRIRGRYKAKYKIQGK